MAFLTAHKLARRVIAFDVTAQGVEARVVGVAALRGRDCRVETVKV